MKIVNVCSHTFLTGPLSAGSIALDCGANTGEFSTWITERTGATVHAFEPDPRLIPKQPKLPKVHFRQIAIASVPGKMMLNLGRQCCSSVRYVESGGQESVEVLTIDLPSYCAKEGLEQIDLLKLDIEGAELDVLSRLPEEFLGRIAQITVEFHDFLEPKDRPQIRQIIARLRRLGFHYISFSVWSYGDVLFANERLVRLSLLDKVWLRLSGKYLPGCRRIFKKLLP